MENEHRDHGILGWRTSRRQQSGAQFQELVGRELDEAVTAASIIPTHRRGAIIFRCLSFRTKIHSTARCRTNDVTHGQFKPEAPLVIPWFKQAYTGPGQSVCKDRWIAIRKGNRTCYAQWEDCGPFRTDHFQYVFQNERPKPNLEPWSWAGCFAGRP